MKKMLLVLSFILWPIWANSGPLGPLADSKTTVTTAGYSQFYTVMQTALQELGQEEFIKNLYLNGLQVNFIPGDATPNTVTEARYNRILSPTDKKSLLREMTTAVGKKKVKIKSADFDPVVASLFVLTVADTYQEPKATRVRDFINSHLLFSNSDLE